MSPTKNVPKLRNSDHPLMTPSTSYFVYCFPVFVPVVNLLFSLCFSPVANILTTCVQLFFLRPSSFLHRPSSIFGLAVVVIDKLGLIVLSQCRGA